MDSETQGHMDIIASYGRSLEKNENPVRDISELPHSKSRIKDALRFALVNFDRLFKDENLRRMLIQGYLHLADFQDFGGSPPGIISEMSETNFDDEVTEASDMLLQGTESLRDALVLVEKERATLEGELATIGSSN